jgi:hypothetical protein
MKTSFSVVRVMRAIAMYIVVSFILFLASSLDAVAFPLLSSVSPNPAVVVPGGTGVVVTVNGTGLEQITRCLVIRNSNLLSGVTATLGTVATSRRSVKLQALDGVATGNAQLRVFSGTSFVDVPLTAFRISIPSTLAPIPIKTQILTPGANRVPTRYVYLQADTLFDIDRVWLVTGGTGGLTKVLISNDLTAWVDFSTFDVNATNFTYKARMVLSLAVADKPHYLFEYEQRYINIGKVYLYSTDGFTVGRNFSDTPSSDFHPTQLKFSDVTGPGKWELLRETMFIFDNPQHRFEQVYRGPDGQLYLFRKAYGPELFKLPDQGYNLYNLSEFN